jgi:hypothetical protein
MDRTGELAPWLLVGLIGWLYDAFIIALPPIALVTERLEIACNGLPTL